MAEKTPILLVDDNEDILFLLRTNLVAAGFVTLCATDGRMALEMIDEHRPDLVLLDLMMPVMDGWAVLEELDRRDHPPAVIVVSATDAETSVRRAERHGVLAYVTKPFSLPSLLRLIREALDRASSAGRPSAAERR